MFNQINVCQNIVKSLDETSCLVHCDFSENFACGYSKEIQSAHYGGSHQQASLHTGILYTKGEVTPFCSISDSLEHGPAGIWCHLEPNLEIIRNKTNIVNISFFTDGPATQYKQKLNFHTFATTSEIQRFEWSAWHFFESSHGKGAPDGVGAAVKRSADELMKRTDIPTPKVLYEELSKNNKSSIKLFWIAKDTIESRKKEMESAVQSLAPIKGTKDIHQLVNCPERGYFLVKDLSCSCKNECQCWPVKRVTCMKKATVSEKRKPRNLFDSFDA